MTADVVVIGAGPAGCLERAPLDPFTHAPLEYEPNAEPPRIYSVGADQEADAALREGGDDVVVGLSLAALERGPFGILIPVSRAATL